MTEKHLLLGDEALALGALHAGLSGVYAYPGTPSTEIIIRLPSREGSTVIGAPMRRPLWRRLSGCLMRGKGPWSA